MSDRSDRIPVIVGVGQVNDRPETLDRGLDPVGLMAAALRAADIDAGGGWLATLDSLSVVDQISFRELNPVVGKVAEAIGASPTIAEQTPLATGDSPIRLLHDAANRIGAGEIVVAAVVGGEALRTAAQRAAAAAGDDTSAHNASRNMSSRNAQRSYRGRYGLAAPVDVYPLYENAGRAAYQQTLAESQQESGMIWSLFSEVAAHNAGAWIRKPVSIEEIVTPSASNRPIAFPYNKLMVANSSVNQGAGFIITSLAKAREMGVADDQIVYVGKGAAAHENPDPLQRDVYDHSPSMGVSLRRTLELNELSIDEIDCVELYSCFPCVPKMARRVLGWAADRPATVFGGLTFGGGPIGNYMSHAVVSMVQKLREGGTNGLLFANGGFATENHSILISRRPQPADTFPQAYDFQAEANAARGPVPPLDEEYTGPGTIETYTVLYDRNGAPRQGVVVARNLHGARFLAVVPSEDQAMIAFLTDGATEPVGSPGQATPGKDGLAIWSLVAA